MEKVGMGQESQPEVVKAQDENKKQKVRTSTKWAIGVTVVWLGGVAAYVVCHWYKFVNMEPNALGDFLAGTMSPLAFFWLVAGYRQQGEELRLNTRALEAQLRELALQVGATKELGESAKKQATIAEENHMFDKQKFEYEEAEKKAAYKKKISPVLDVKYNYSTANMLVLRLLNNGADAFDIELSRRDGMPISMGGNIAKMRKDTENELKLSIHRESVDAAIDFSVVCLDVDKYRHEFNFTAILRRGEVAVTQNFEMSFPTDVENPY